MAPTVDWQSLLDAIEQEQLQARQQDPWLQTGQALNQTQAPKDLDWKKRLLFSAAKGFGSGFFNDIGQTGVDESLNEDYSGLAQGLEDYEQGGTQGLIGSEMNPAYKHSFALADLQRKDAEKDQLLQNQGNIFRGIAENPRMAESYSRLGLMDGSLGFDEGEQKPSGAGAPTPPPELLGMTQEDSPYDFGDVTIERSLEEKRDALIQKLMSEDPTIKFDEARKMADTNFKDELSAKNDQLKSILASAQQGQKIRGFAEEALSAIPAAGGTGGPLAGAENFLLGLGSYIPGEDPFQQKATARAQLDKTSGVLAAAQREVGSGNMSDKDMELLQKHAPSSKQYPEVNQSIAEGLIALADRKEQQAQFFTWWTEQDKGSFGSGLEVWKKYTQANPIWKEQDGKPQINKIPSWREFFAKKSSSSKPNPKEYPGNYEAYKAALDKWRASGG